MSPATHYWERGLDPGQGHRRLEVPGVSREKLATSVLNELVSILGWRTFTEHRVRRVSRTRDFCPLVT